VGFNESFDALLWGVMIPPHTESQRPNPRSTRQRRAIRDAVQRLARPLSPMEILEAAQAEIPGLGLATVYRTIRVLQEEGALREVLIPGDPPRYESAGKGHHHHFCCTDCRRVLELEGCRPEVNTLVPPGFEQHYHELTFFGRCADCLGKAKS
jgi:Fur family transcriptional regulator, ferric uptake regulator